MSLWKMLLFVAALYVPSLFAQNTCQDILVPLYVYPSGTANRAIWTRSAADTLPSNNTRYIVVNPNNGEISGWTSSANSFDITNWTWAINTVHAGHGTGSWLAVAYIHTSFGARSLSAVEADIDAYEKFFPTIDAFFVDETATDASLTSYYAAVVAHIQSAANYPYADVVFNAGAYPPTSALLNISHASGTNLVLGVYENNYGSSGYSPTVPAWVTHQTSGHYDYGDQHFMTLLYNLPAASSNAVVASTYSHRNGVVFVTDSTAPWDGLGGYWNSLLTQTEAGCN